MNRDARVREDSGSLKHRQFAAIEGVRVEDFSQRAISFGCVKKDEPTEWLLEYFGSGWADLRLNGRDAEGDHNQSNGEETRPRGDRVEKR